MFSFSIFNTILCKPVDHGSYSHPKTHPWVLTFFVGLVFPSWFSGPIQSPPFSEILIPSPLVKASSLDLLALLLPSSSSALLLLLSLCGSLALPRLRLYQHGMRLRSWHHIRAPVPSPHLDSTAHRPCFGFAPSFPPCPDCPEILLG